MDSSANTIAPYIIAGGQSLRMRQDKRLLNYKGMTLLERVYMLAKSVTGREPVIVGDNLNDPAFDKYLKIPDAAQGMGPIGGIVAALENSHADWTLILPVDMPELTSEMISGLINCADDNCDSVNFSVGEFIECFPILLRTSTLSFWRERLAVNELVLINGIKLLRYKTIDYSSGSDALLNLNTPRDVSTD